jgi:hypothetical protein
MSQLITESFEAKTLTHLVPREQLREALLHERNKGNLFPESLPYTLHNKPHTALLTDVDVGLKRGTKLTDDQEGIVAYYSVVGHSDFGADSGMKEGQMWYFAYADEEHCANWSYHDEWTGDSYWNVTGTDYEYLSDMVIQ